MFTVIPASGMLLPQQSDGTLLKVTYKPTFYGKIHKGRLLIQVKEEMIFFYLFPAMLLKVSLKTEY